MSNKSIIATAGGKKNKIVFSLSEFEGRRIFDIRKFYTDKNSGELKPTKKGITLSKNSFEVTKGVIADNEDEILSWLCSDTAIVSDIKKDIRLKGKHSKEARFQAQEFVVDHSAWKSPEFFSVTAEGGKDRLTLNTKHDFVKELLRLLETEESDDDNQDSSNVIERVRELFWMLLLSFGKARHLYENSEASAAAVVLDTTVYNWGLYLNQNVINKRHKK